MHHRNSAGWPPCSGPILLPCAECIMHSAPKAQSFRVDNLSTTNSSERDTNLDASLHQRSISALSMTQTQRGAMLLPRECRGRGPGSLCRHLFGSIWRTRRPPVGHPALFLIWRRCRGLASSVPRREQSVHHKYYLQHLIAVGGRRGVSQMRWVVMANKELQASSR